MTKNDRDLSPRFSNDCWLNAERIFWDYEIDIPFLIFQRGRQKRKKQKKAHKIDHKSQVLDESASHWFTVFIIIIIKKVC